MDFQTKSIAIQQAQQKQYSIQDLNYIQFFLDKRLTSSQRSSIQKGLQQLESFIKLLFTVKIHDKTQGKIIYLTPLQQTKIRQQLIRSILRRLLDLFLNLKIIGLKNLVGKILIKNSHCIKQIAVTVKDQIVNTISRGIKGMDQFTRVIASRIVNQYTGMGVFEKDIIVFQMVLERVREFNGLVNIKGSSGVVQIVSSEIVEMKYFQECLKRMLGSSISLSQIFLKDIQRAASSRMILNINQETELLFIKHIRIDKFYEFCMNAKLQPNQKLKVYNFLLKSYQMRQNRLKIDYNQINQKVSKYLQKIYEENKSTFQRKPNTGQQPQNEAQLLQNKNLSTKRKHNDMGVFFISIKQFNLLYHKNNNNQLNKSQHRFLKILQNISSNSQSQNQVPILQKIQHKRRNILILKQFCQLYQFYELDFFLKLIKIWQMIFVILIKIMEMGQGQFNLNLNESEQMMEEEGSEVRKGGDKAKVEALIKEFLQMLKKMFIGIFQVRKLKNRSLSNQGVQKRLQRQIKSYKNQKNNTKECLVQKQLLLLREIYSFFKNSWNQYSSQKQTISKSSSVAFNQRKQFIQKLLKFQWARISNKIIVEEIFPRLTILKKKQK